MTILLQSSLKQNKLIYMAKIILRNHLIINYLTALSHASLLKCCTKLNALCCIIEQRN